MRNIEGIMFSNRPEEPRDDWQSIYSQCRLSEEGITWNQFMEDPWEALRRVGQEDAPASVDMGYLPLLPKQAAVVRRLWAQWDAEDRAEREAKRAARRTAQSEVADA